MVDAWFKYWIDVKRKTVRPNTVRNYTERYRRNIQNVIGKKLLTEVEPIHCKKILQIWQMKGIERLQYIKHELYFLIYLNLQKKMM